MFFRKKSKTALDAARMPRHIAIIMDGNGRWATERGLSRSMGHSAGAETFRKISEKCNELGISCLTVYAFSTENWSRPAEEVNAIMGLLRRYLKEASVSLIQKNVRLHVIGDRTNLPKDIVESIEEIHKMAEQCTGIRVNLAINYGGRREIMQAAQKLAYDAVKGLIDPEKIDEAALESRLYTAGLPDPDLLIRTGSEQRISNFLLWQAAYAELYFTKVLWPSFGEADLLEAIAWFQARNRRFGGV